MFFIDSLLCLVTVRNMEATFFYAMIVLTTFLVANGHQDEGPSITASTPTALSTVNGEIAHFTCTTRGPSSTKITWEKEGHKLGGDSPGIVILSWNNGTILESHLLVAVTSDERRGSYTCVVVSDDGESRQSFVIQGQGTTKLTDIDYTAIGVAIGITLCLSAVILFYLIRGCRRLKEGKLTTTSTLSVNGHDNAAVEEETTSDDIALSIVQCPSKSAKL